MADADRPGAGDTLRIVELAEQLRTMEVTLLRARGSMRGVDTDVVATSATIVPAGEIAVVKDALEELGEQYERLMALADGLRVADVEVRLVPLQVDAEAALADGVLDVDRVRILAECLTVRHGLRALATMLRTTDCHTAWGATSVGDVLSWFRGSDTAFARRLAGLASVPAETTWAGADAETISRLATVLEDHAPTERCR